MSRLHHDAKIDIKAKAHQVYLFSLLVLQANYLDFLEPMAQSEIQVSKNNIL